MNRRLDNLVFGNLVLWELRVNALGLMMFGFVLDIFGGFGDFGGLDNPQVIKNLEHGRSELRHCIL